MKITTCVGRHFWAQSSMGLIASAVLLSSMGCGGGGSKTASSAGVPDTAQITGKYRLVSVNGETLPHPIIRIKETKTDFVSWGGDLTVRSDGTFESLLVNSTFVNNKEVSTQDRAGEGGWERKDDTLHFKHTKGLGMGKLTIRKDGSLTRTYVLELPPPSPFPSSNITEVWQK